MEHFDGIDCKAYCLKADNFEDLMKMNKPEHNFEAFAGCSKDWNMFVALILGTGRSLVPDIAAVVGMVVVDKLEVYLVINIEDIVLAVLQSYFVGQLVDKPLDQFESSNIAHQHLVLGH